MPSSPFLAAALGLADLGYPVIPLNEDRHPVMKGWPDASAGSDETRERFARSDAVGLAIVIRPSHFVIDLDRGHKDGADGIKEFSALVQRHANDFPRNGPRVRSRSGGIHSYLRAPPDALIRSSASVLGPGIDCKGARSCVTAPPTGGYTWINPICPVAELPMAPEWLLGLVSSKPPPPRPQFPPRDYGGAYSRYGAAAVARELSTVYRSGQGKRSCALFAASARLGALIAGGVLPEHGVREALEDAARACGLVADDGERTALTHIERGLAAGRTNPRSPTKTGGRR